LLENKGEPAPVHHAYQIMSRPAASLVDEWTITKAIKRFDELPYQLFPIINFRKKLVGSLSRRQLYKFVLKSGKNNANNQTLSQCFLTTDSRVYAVDAVTDVRRLTRLMVEQRLDAVPVVNEQEEVAGIVSRTDILRCVGSEPPLSLWC